MQPLLDGMMESLLEETDPEIAAAAMASDLKLLEGMLRSAPDDRRLLTLASQAFTGYAMLFLDPEQPERARELYRRGRDYGLRVLAQRSASLADPEASFARFEGAVGVLRDDDMEAVYWTAVGWGGWINLSRGDPAASADFPRARLLMEWVEKRDPSFFFAGPLWFFGVYYATLPPLLGGSPAKSRDYFTRAVEATGGRFLWGKLLFAQTYAVQTLDRELFERLLKEVSSGATDEPSAARLLNRVATRRAAVLLSRADELF